VICADQSAFPPYNPFTAIAERDAQISGSVGARFYDSALALSLAQGKAKGRKAKGELPGRLGEDSQAVAAGEGVLGDQRRSPFRSGLRENPFSSQMQCLHFSHPFAHFLSPSSSPHPPTSVISPAPSPNLPNVGASEGLAGSARAEERSGQDGRANVDTRSPDLEVHAGSTPISPSHSTAQGWLT
jgi:hypothetical protein